jgi:hypothetical protein
MKSLRGFFILRGYYRKFVKNCGKIATPLTLLLKKNVFVHNGVVAQAFVALKDAMCTTPILTMPKFNKTFVLECDASSRCLARILMQEGHPFAFINKKLCDRDLGKSTYEKQMMEGNDGYPSCSGDSDAISHTDQY